MSSPPLFKIAIVGAGPAGCTLGRLLHLAGIEFTIFEAEKSLNVRSQGGTLDLRAKTGLAAVEAAGLYKEFLRCARFDGEAICIADKNLRSYFSAGPSGSTEIKTGARPEIDRIQLRQLLFDSLPKDCIKWGHKLRRIGEDLTLIFDDQKEAGPFDLIVGADGAWSKTRNFLSDQKPFYAGIAGIEQQISDVEKRYPDLHKLVNKGSLYCFSDHHAILAQQNGDGSIRVSVWGMRDEIWAKEHDASKMGAVAVKALFEIEYADWAPELRKILEVVDNEGMVTRALYMLPIGFQWENKPGVTIIGDAAHVMVPFAGEGANLSMADAMYLARWIKKSKDKSSLHENIAKFEQELAMRAKPVQQVSYDNMEDMFFIPGAPRTTIASYLTRMARQLAGPFLGALAAGPIYLYYFLINLFS